MPTYERCPKAVEELAKEILNKHETHKPLIEEKVKIDFCFAYGDDNSDAITKGGVKCLGLAKKIALKERGSRPR